MSQKPTKPAKRRTFLSYEEILGELVDRCRYMDETLRKAIPEIEEPYRETYRRVADTEAGLAEGLGEFARSGAPAIRSMQFQYLPDDDDLGLEPTDPDLLNAVERANEAMQVLLTELAEKIAADSPKAEFLRLAEKVDTVNQKISFIRDRESEV